jgi:bis(5'-nucleosyl)-tetraphosphatase (symmetrical)
VTRYAVGDVQGCHEELRTLLARLKFSADRDQLWLVGDLVNRGPSSLKVLRLVRDLGANAVVVLGNHDLHLLAVARGARRKRKSDTLDEILEAPDRDMLLEWLRSRPLAHWESGDLMVHAGLVPQWTLAQAVSLSREIEQALATAPDALLAGMYGDEPERWSDELAGMERLRFAINVLTRLRVCTADGRIDLKLKGKPPHPGSPFKPWFELDTRRSSDARIIFGHWSALGLVLRERLAGLDSGCVWGGALTAINLDVQEPPVAVSCSSYQEIGTD